MTGAIDEISRAHRLALWGSATAVVAAGSLALLVVGFSRESVRMTDPDTDGAVVVELAPVTVSAPPPPAHVPPGPPAIAPLERLPPVTAVPPAQPKLDLPPLPSLTDAPPDLVLPRPKAEPDHATEAAPPAAPAAASAPPKVDAAPVGRTAAAAVRGLSDRERRALARWQVAIAAHLNLFKQAPANTRRKSGPMTVQVRFSIAPDGRVIDVAVHHSSGEAGYDAAAVAIVRRASPVPAPPPSAAASDLDFIIPIRFQPGD